MRVTQLSPELLVIEEDASTRTFFGGGFAALGAILIVVAVMKEQRLGTVVGALFLFFGLKTLLFGRVHTHRFERSRMDPGRGRVTISARALWRSHLQELPFERIADIVIEATRGGRGRTVYYIHYVTKAGERIEWADTYDIPKEDVFNCSRVAREFVGLPAGDPLVFAAGKRSPREVA